MVSKAVLIFFYIESSIQYIVDFYQTLLLCFSYRLMMGEILPAKIRGTAASVATGFNWSCTFIVTKSFADLIGKFR